MNKTIIFLMMLSTFVYSSTIPIDQAQRAAKNKISSFYNDSWVLSTNFTYYTELDDVAAYCFVFTNLQSKALDDKYKTTTTATFETYTDSEQPIVLKVYKGMPDVMLWKDDVPKTMQIEKYIMISPIVTAIALSSNGVSYYQNDTLKKVQVKLEKATSNSLNNVFTNDKYKQMAIDAWKRYEK